LSLLLNPPTASRLALVLASGITPAYCYCLLTIQALLLKDGEISPRIPGASLHRNDKGVIRTFEKIRGIGLFISNDRINR
jgi:hypothetical protein